MQKRNINKKGSLLDIAFIVAVAVFFGMVMLIGAKISGEFNSNINSMSGIPTEAKTASDQVDGQFSGTIDKLFLFLTIFTALASLVLASLVRVHPVFIPLFIIGLIFVVLVAGVASNIYQGAAESTVLSSTADELNFISNILEFLPLIIAVLGFIMMAVMYKLWSNDQ